MENLKNISEPFIKLNKDNLNIVSNNFENFKNLKNLKNLSISKLVKDLDCFKNFIYDNNIKENVFTLKNNIKYNFYKVKYNENKILLFLNENKNKSDFMLLYNTFIYTFENFLNGFIFVKNLTDNKVLFETTISKVKDKLSLYGNDFLESLYNYLDLIKFNNVEKSILKNEDISFYDFKEYILINNLYYKLIKKIAKIGEKKILFLLLYNISDLKKNLDSLEIEATRDKLTNLYNRNYFLKKFEEEKKIHKKYEKTLSLILLDIDKFKFINDNFGHDFGDKVLKEFSKILNKNIRDNDVLCRFGGEEFLILLPLTFKDIAIKIAERLRLIIEKSFKNYDSKRDITASFGVVSYNFRKGSISFEELYKKVDEALYTAKNNGRNLVIYKECNKD